MQLYRGLVNHCQDDFMQPVKHMTSYHARYEMSEIQSHGGKTFQVGIQRRDEADGESLSSILSRVLV